MTLPDPDLGQTREFDTSLCANCGDPASFVDNRPGANPIGYCAKDLPDSLQLAAASGQLAVAEDSLQAVNEEPLPELGDDEQTEVDADKAAERVDKAARRR